MMRRRGFTVIELMIVVIIIGTLAGIFLLSAASSTVNASTTRIIGEFKTLKKGVLLYTADNGNSLPGNIEELQGYFDRGLSSNLATYQLEHSDDNTLWLKAEVKEDGIRNKLAVDNETKGLSLFEGPDGCTPYAGVGPIYTAVARSGNFPACLSPLSPLGNDFFEITGEMTRRMREYYVVNDGHVSTWHDSRYEALGLDQDFWKNPVGGMEYVPHGRFIKVRPVDENISIKVQTRTGQEKILDSRLNWNIWIDTETGEGYFHNKDDEDELFDLDTVEIIRK